MHVALVRRGTEPPRRRIRIRLHQEMIPALNGRPRSQGLDLEVYLPMMPIELDSFRGLEPGGRWAPVRTSPRLGR